MNGVLTFAAGVVVGLAISFFTSLLTELIVLAAVGAVVFYVGRKRWITHSTTKPSQSSSPSPTDLL